MSLEDILIEQHEKYMQEIDESGVPKWVSDYYINYQEPIKNMEIKSRTELEMFAAHLKQNVYDLPTNLRLLVILEKEDFDKMVNDISTEIKKPEDRFIYMSHSGVEFGIKCII